MVSFRSMSKICIILHIKRLEENVFKRNQELPVLFPPQRLLLLFFLSFFFLQLAHSSRETMCLGAPESAWFSGRTVKTHQEHLG